MMLTHFEKIVASRKEHTRVVALNRLIREIFQMEEVCGTSYTEDKLGWQIATTTPEKKYQFSCDYGWGVMLSVINNPGYRIRECWYISLDGATLIHKVYKNGRLQMVD